MANLFVDERVAYYDTQDKDNRIEVKLVDSVIDAPLYKPKPTHQCDWPAECWAALIGAADHPGPGVDVGGHPGDAGTRRAKSWACRSIAVVATMPSPLCAAPIGRLKEAGAARIS